MGTGDEPSLSVWAAVHEVELALKVSRGRAQEMLRQACVRGEIRSGELDDNGIRPWPASVWADAVFDRPELIVRGIATLYAEINLADLEDWLRRAAGAAERMPSAAVPSEPSPVAAAQPGRAHQREAALAALRTHWPNGVPDGSSVSITNRINKHRAAEKLGVLSPRTVRRALSDRRRELAGRRT
jgi:hypothetical protein